MAFWGNVAILGLGLGILLVLAPYDQAITEYLAGQDYKTFARFMDVSVFEGEGFGGSDFPLLLLIGLLLVYLFSFFRLPKAWQPYHRHLEYVVISGAITALLAVHTLKWLTGRPRPRWVWEQGLPFNDWFEFGVYFIAEGKYRGSFPSGHTATVLLLVPLVYVFFWFARKPPARTGAYLFALFVFVFSALMAVSRSMLGAHWITDGTFSILLAWLIAHNFFFFVFRFQDPETGIRVGSGLQLFGWAALFCAGLFFFGTGLRAIWREALLWTAGIPAGLLLMGLGWLGSKRLLNTRKNEDK